MPPQEKTLMMIIGENYRLLLYGSLGLIAVGMFLLWYLGKVPAGYNLRNLMIRWKTTLMTALAFTLVVALMTVMMAFVNGMYSLTQNSGQPGNVIVLSSGSNDEGFSSLAFDDVANVERIEGIASAGGKRLASKEVFVIANQQRQVAPGQPPRRRFLQVRGLEDPQIAAQVHGLALLPGGQWFSDAGVEEAPEGAGQVYLQGVLGHGIATELGNDRLVDKRPLTVGDTFEMADRTWKVVGILDSDGSTFDSEIWGKRQVVGQQFGKETSYSSFVVRAHDERQAAELAQSLKNSKQVALNALTEKEYFSNMGETSRTFMYAIVVVAVVMGVGGVFGVMNTMFAAISQRIKDIGVLRILGYGRRHILMSFLLESLVLALLGGLLGCALGSLADGWTARSVVGGAGGGGKFVVLHLVVSKEILATGVLLSLVMGGLGGFLPALRAMRMRALESLR
jgi:hypothetical protein